MAMMTTDELMEYVEKLEVEERDELLARVKTAEAKITRLTELRDYWRETGLGHWRELSEIIEK